MLRGLGKGRRGPGRGREEDRFAPERKRCLTGKLSSQSCSALSIHTVEWAEHSFFILFFLVWPSDSVNMGCVGVSAGNEVVWGERESSRIDQRWERDLISWVEHILHVIGHHCGCYEKISPKSLQSSDTWNPRIYDYLQPKICTVGRNNPLANGLILWDDIICFELSWLNGDETVRRCF